MGWFVWGLGGALYLIAFYQRVAPAVMTQELAREFELTAASLGNLSAFYYYGYVAVQIPTGLLADRFGPRKVLTAGALLTAIGTLLFALAPNAFIANSGRLFIGSAAGVAFVSMLKLASHWMPARMFALTAPTGLLVGTIGATFAGAPLRVAVDAFGWRPVMVASAIVTALVAVAIWIVMRDDPKERGYASYYPEEVRGEAAASIPAQLRETLANRNVLLLFLIPGALAGIVLAFAGLWGVPFLVTQYGFAPAKAATTMSAMLICWSLGGIAWGAISERARRRKPFLAAGLVGTMALWSIVVFTRDLPHAALVAVLLATSAAAGAVMLAFPYTKESVPARIAGTASGITNMGMMVGGMVMQPLIGWVLDRNWSGAMLDGARIYDFAAYQRGFALMLVWCAAALVLLAFTREARR